MASIPLKKRLSYKQAMTGVAVAVTLGIAMSVIQITFDYYNFVNSQVSRVDEIIRTTEKNATYAAYNIDKQNAMEITEGLVLFKPIVKVSLTTEFGEVLGISHLNGTYERRSFAQVIEKSLELRYGPKEQVVGYLYLTLDLSTTIDQFIARASTIIFTGLFKNILLSAVLLVLFDRRLTTPILRLANTLLRQKERQGEDAVPLVELPERDEDDELDLLIRSHNELVHQAREQKKQLSIYAESLEERVQERTKELEAFNYMVSHDLSSALQVIQGYAEALNFDLKDNNLEGSQDCLDAIEGSCQDISKMIDSLLWLSRASQSEICAEHVNLSDEVAQAIRQCQLMEPHRPCDIDIEPDLIVMGDKALLRQVVVNLVNNSWKYAKNELLLQMKFGSYEDPQKGKVYYLRDNGVGFSMSAAESIFQPFQRLHEEREFKGTGIGLATVARIIRRHGGEVWCESKIKEGASFYFYLPTHLKELANLEANNGSPLVKKPKASSTPIKEPLSS